VQVSPSDDDRAVKLTVDLVDAFLSQALSRGSLPAVEHNGTSTSYEELTVLAEQIAGAIHLASSKPSPRVLLALPPSAAAYAAMIGTLIAGGTFCPVNVDGPEVRNATIARAFAPNVILFDGAPSSFLDASPATTPRIDVSRPGTCSLDAPSAQYSEVAYVVFTSGSSGQPKGVKIGRHGFSHFLSIARTYFDITPDDRWGQFSNLGYDLAIMDVFIAVTQGGTLVPLASPMERLMPATAIEKRHLTIWHSVPSVLELMIRARQVSAHYLASLRLMSFCGEPLLPRHLDALFAARPDLQVFNTYGTTETTGFNTINRLTADNYRASCEAPTVSLGEEVPGWNLSLHGGESENEGEIVVSGDALSLGYWCDEDRTRDAFRQLRSSSVKVRRSYFTGDWGVRKNSRLYFSGRIDRQVKIKGERIELDEIDYLLRDAGFSAAFTIVVGEALHSFVESDDNVDEERIRARLTKQLPFHSIPKAIRAVPNLPRNANGKIDRGALERCVTP
jgi:D-alanine--poly(phosphoribitol) ligase subunit 1